MDPPSAPDADNVEGSPAPQLPDIVQPTSVLTETEPRIVENQTLEDLPSPEELQTPDSDAYTLVLETPSERQPRFPSPIAEETKLYDEDGKSIEMIAPEEDDATVSNSPSPQRSIEEIPHEQDSDRTLAQPPSSPRPAHKKLKGFFGKRIKRVLRQQPENLADATELLKQLVNDEMAYDLPPPKPSQAASLEDQRGFYRQDAFISRRVHQLRHSPPGSSGSDGPILPPGLQITSEAEEAYLEKLRQRDREIYTPFRHARIPELRELGPPARVYNAGVSALEDENMRKVDRPVVERPPKRSFFGTVLNWAHSIVRGNVESHGVRLCSHCSRYLDRMNPPRARESRRTALASGIGHMAAAETSAERQRGDAEMRRLPTS
ncbi:hypothetical protein NQ176_g10828 [Zarea fungicola]|uniref:Uncharacterized protein n=1 Tax=Zarea fungicola TaxID=93591 RepID=A0ACC1MDR2_9HYPO|nr:hypothetical protein NQ176_g10828 [Lecanicillium fungicola]